MKRSVLFMVMMASLGAFGQLPDTLTLSMCHEMAVASCPATARAELISSASEIQQKKLNANYLPQVQVNGQASYQSDVTKVDVEIPSFYIPPPIDLSVQPTPLNTPVPSRDQYKFTMDLQQVIYDGGMTGSRKKMELAGYEIERQKVEIELHKLRENINTVFFSIVLMQENEKLLNLLLNDLNNKYQEVNSAVEHGLALTSDRNVLRAGILRVEQQLEETAIQKEAFTAILSQLVSEDLPFPLTLAMPEPEIPANHSDPRRPEITMYDMQKTLLETNKDFISSSWMPRLSGFGQLGYGNPGLNFLEDEWTPFYIVGARLNWQIWNWNQNRKEKQILGLRQGMVDREREAFGINLNIALEQHMADMRKYEKLIMKDREVISLRSEISKTSSSQYDNGVITSSDYVSRLNEEAQARLDLEMHKVMLVKARVDYLTTLGIL